MNEPKEGIIWKAFRVFLKPLSKLLSFVHSGAQEEVASSYSPSTSNPFTMVDIASEKRRMAGIRKLRPLKRQSGNTMMNPASYLSESGGFGLSTIFNPSISFTQPTFSLPKLQDTSTDFRSIQRGFQASFPSFSMSPTKPHHLPEEFHSFNKLPLEIQIEIWKLSIADIDPRLVTLRNDIPDIPGVIQACKVSRRESKRTFRFCVVPSKGGSGSGLTPKPYQKKSYRFFNPTKDTFHFTSEPVLGMIEEPTLLSLARSYNDCMQSIVRIALDLQVVGATVTAERTANHMGLWDVLLPLCPDLENLYVVVAQPKRDGLKVLKPLQGLWFDKFDPRDLPSWPSDLESRGLMREAILYFAVMKQAGIPIAVDFVKMRERMQIETYATGVALRGN